MRATAQSVSRVQARSTAGGDPLADATGGAGAGRGGADCAVVGLVVGAVADGALRVSRVRQPASSARMASVGIVCRDARMDHGLMEGQRAMPAELTPAAFPPAGTCSEPA